MAAIWVDVWQSRRLPSARRPSKELDGAKSVRRRQLALIRRISRDTNEAEEYRFLCGAKLSLGRWIELEAQPVSQSASDMDTPKADRLEKPHHNYCTDGLQLAYCTELVCERRIKAGRLLLSGGPISFSLSLSSSHFNSLPPASVLGRKKLFN